MSYVLVSEKNFKKKKLVEILACFMFKSLQAGQLSQVHLFFLQNLMNFIIKNYLKEEVDDDLSICIDELSPCGLSVTKSIKIYQCHMIQR